MYLLLSDYAFFANNNNSCENSPLFYRIPDLSMMSTMQQSWMDIVGLRQGYLENLIEKESSSEEVKVVPFPHLPRLLLAPFSPSSELCKATLQLFSSSAFEGHFR